LHQDNFLLIKFTSVNCNIACNVYSLYFPELYFWWIGRNEQDDICYYLYTFYVVSVEFMATLNRVKSILFKNWYERDYVCPNTL